MYLMGIFAFFLLLQPQRPKKKKKMNHELETTQRDAS